jgi:hypothetical protein
MKEPQVPEGKTYVHGRSQDKAVELLDLAEKAGLAGQVATTSHGYIVPSAIFADGGDTNSESPEDADGEEKADQFDPSAATVDEVKEYLDGADDTERERVLAAEEAGKGRKGILDLADTEGAK